MLARSIESQKRPCSNAVFCLTFHVIEGLNARDQIALYAFQLFPNKRWLHTYTCCACLKTTWRLAYGSSRRPQKWWFRGFLSLISFLYFSLLSIEYQHWNWRPASWRNFNACFPKWLFWGFVHLEDSGASQFSSGNHHRSPTVQEMGRLPCDTRWWWLLKSLDWQIWPLCQRFCYFVLEWEISFFTNGVYCFQFKW